MSNILNDQNKLINNPNNRIVLYNGQVLQCSDSATLAVDIMTNIANELTNGEHIALTITTLKCVGDMHSITTVIGGHSQHVATVVTNDLCDVDLTQYSEYDIRCTLRFMQTIHSTLGTEHDAEYNSAMLLYAYYDEAIDIDEYVMWLINPSIGPIKRRRHGRTNISFSNAHHNLPIRISTHPQYKSWLHVMSCGVVNNR